MRSGEIITRQKQIPLPGTPALGIHPPVQRNVTHPEPVTVARASWFAAATAYVSCLLGKHECPVYITEGMSPRSGVLAFIEGAGMISKAFNKGTEKELQDLAYLAGRFNYPVHLRVPSDVLDKLPYDSYSPAFLSVDRLTAASLCTRNAGIILRDAPLKDGEEMPPFDDVLWYLAELQKRGFAVEGETLTALLRDICQFMDGYLTQFDQAHAAIATGQIRVCQKAGDSLIELLTLLCLSGKLGMEYFDLQPCLDKAYPPAPGKRAVCIDPEKGRVYLPRKATIRACDRAGIPRPDLYRAEKELSERKLLLPNPLSDGILIAAGLWEEVVKGCRRELNTSP
jgi:hypothetical protein